MLNCHIQFGSMCLKSFLVILKLKLHMQSFIYFRLCYDWYCKVKTAEDYQCSYCLMMPYEASTENCTGLNFFYFYFPLSTEDPEQKALEFLCHTSEMVLLC